MEQNKISGVYKITNNITGDFYIGSSKNIEKRWANHKSPSTHKQHPNSKLYKDMDQYGCDNFTIEVIEETDFLKEREQYWIEYLKPSYNVMRAKREIEDFEEAHKQFYKVWYNTHLDECLAKNKAYKNRLCLYNGDTLTLGALSKRFCRQGIPHPTLNAKKYLIERSI